MPIEEYSTGQSKVGTTGAQPQTPSPPVWNTCHSCGKSFIVNDSQSWQCLDCRTRVGGKKPKWKLRKGLLHPPWQKVAIALVCTVPVCLLAVLISMTYQVSIPWFLAWAVGLILVGSALLFISITFAPVVNAQVQKLQHRWEKFKQERQGRARRHEEEKRRQEEEEERARQKIVQEEQESIRRQKEKEERQWREAEEADARRKWKEIHESKTMEEVRNMSGIEFEKFLARLFSKMGYTDITLTPANDFGGDLLCRSPGGVRIAVQAKRWTEPVGFEAVKEVVAAIPYYGCDEGMVVTNSTFTTAAREYARKVSHITLHDGRWLEQQINKSLPHEIPEFNWEEYNRIIREFKSGRKTKTKTRTHRRRWTAPEY